ncbi:MAG: hypothetical protein AUH43_10860 [Acidobacteria bacterium 13_1_40CM_65_14]|nr:MAG: hypothetical protein AUH43_10860 [Acidobacteria bacterium 13_1_40CM_65_14]
MSEDRLDRIEHKLDALANGMTTVVVRVEQLDRDMKSGFADMDRRFGHVDQKFTRLEQRLEQRMDAGFNRLERKLDSIETTQRAINIEPSDKIENHEGRIVKLEKNVTPSGSQTP